MCTVTVLPEAVLTAARVSGVESLRLRVAFNRDELTSRTPALPPIVRQIGSRRAAMPVDPDSGGTWIGVNDAGITCALLNLYDGSSAGAGDLSRGTIIPPLLGCLDVKTVLSRAGEIPTKRYRPFRLLVTDGRELVECWSRGGGLECQHDSLRKAVMRTSSGLGDGLVTAPRTALFQTFLDHATDPVASQDLFHLHRWRGREAISVRMRRPDARTVSHTVVEIRDRDVSLVYRQANAPDGVSVRVAA